MGFDRSFGRLSLVDFFQVLIWDGSALNLPLLSHDLSVVDYQGSPHLSFIDAVQYNGYARGHGVILDSTYRPVKTIDSGNGAVGIDQHEFAIIENGSTALITIYEQRQMPTSIPGLTWVNDCVFQDLDVASGNVKFEWKAADHIPTNLSYVLPRSTVISGDGLTNGTAWDYL